MKKDAHPCIPRNVSVFWVVARVFFDGCYGFMWFVFVLYINLFVFLCGLLTDKFKFETTWDGLHI